MRRVAVGTGIIFGGSLAVLASVAGSEDIEYGESTEAGINKGPVTLKPLDQFSTEECLQLKRCSRTLVEQAATTTSANTTTTAQPRIVVQQASINAVLPRPHSTTTSLAMSAATIPVEPKPQEIIPVPTSAEQLQNLTAWDAPVTGEQEDLGIFDSTCYQLTGITASGARAAPGAVAVDTRIISLGTKLYIEGYGWGVAVDTGGAIKGKIVDIWKPANCRTEWGRRKVRVTRIINPTPIIPTQ